MYTSNKLHQIVGYLKACRFKNVSDVMGLQIAAPDMLVQFDQDAFASAGSSPSPPLLLLPPLRPGGEDGQQMAGPYPSANDEWRMMSSRARQASVYVHKGGLSFWGHAAGSLPFLSPHDRSLMAEAGFMCRMIFT